MARKWPLENAVFGFRSNEYIAAAVTAYVVFVLSGAGNVVMHSTIGGLSAALAKHATEMGAVFSVYSLGRMITLFVSGVLTDKIGSKRVLLAAALLYILFFFTVPISSRYYIVIAAAFLAGSANGMSDSSGMALLLDCFPDNGAAALSFVQIFFGTGMFITPVIAGALLEKNMFWGSIYWGFMIAAAVVFISVSLLKFPKVNRKAEKSALKQEFAVKPCIFREGIALGVLAFLFGAIMSILTVWTVSYLTAYRFVGEASAVRTLAALNFGSLLGALLIARLSKKFHATVFMILYPIVIILGLALSQLSDNGLLIKLSYIIIGIGGGSLYGLSVMVAGELFHEKKGSAVGAVSTASALAGAVMPLLISKLTGCVSLDKIYLAIFMIAGLAFVAAFFFRKRYISITGGKIK